MKDRGFGKSSHLELALGKGINANLNHPSSGNMDKAQDKVTGNGEKPNSKPWHQTQGWRIFLYERMPLLCCCRWPAILHTLSSSPTLPPHE
jgi:hypothetical protein